jgi:hypothetical protein
MTQILAVLTQEYVLVASDRRLTFVAGATRGKVADDNTCKLVSLCGIWGIAYTGFAEIERRPTHEWIAICLAERNCSNPYLAAELLANRATQALRAIRLSLELTFLIAGWVRLSDGKLQPHFLLVSNMFEQSGEKRPRPGTDLNRFERRLQTEELYATRVIGQSLPKGRAKRLDRLFRKMLGRNLGPKPAMYALAKEIANSATVYSTVGNTMLAFSIPRAAANQPYTSGRQMILAKEPDLASVAFCYLNPEYDELRQYGPTHVCGESSVTDVETVNDPSRNFQSSSIRILHMPKKS